ncbi:uncharacterized protein C2845_PM03G25910 [Panicum miliaceum]|uniref:DUF6598 domain-containing protein n=1 Tax=Panicum miliaceum TaxID=4540 RepID=A0A3L6T7Q2_PANMI|nr:uncharacterized protein C2845_PM03G25910 [Panicum miliaceum]
MENLSEELLVFWEEEEDPEEAYVRELEEEQKKRRARWKKSEMSIFMELVLLIKRKKMSELEEAYAMKQAERRSEEEEVQQPNKLMDYLSNLRPLTVRYQQFRSSWMARHPGLDFEHITKIRAMMYTNQPVPKYVYNIVDSLQIYSVKVVLRNSDPLQSTAVTDTEDLLPGQGGLEWPLHVFGLVSVRDSIDSKRNLIFNIQERDDCQTLTEEWQPMRSGRLLFTDTQVRKEMPPFNLPLCILVDIPSLLIPNKEAQLRMQITQKVRFQACDEREPVEVSFKAKLSGGLDKEVTKKKLKIKKGTKGSSSKR